MKRRGKRIVFIVIGILLCLTGVLMIFFNLPFSRTKTEFDKTVMALTAEADHGENVFREEDIDDLPTPVQRYFRYCGYIGKPKMSCVKIYYRDVNFLFGRDKSAIKIDYTQYDFVKGANRIAYIDSSTYGIPFEGLDSFLDGSGSMKGVLAKQFTLFDQTGKVMDKSGLVTFLSEILIFPNAALQDYIRWEEMDDLHAKATISCYGISAAGVFTFHENGEMLSFVTDDRSAVATDGSSETIKWSVACGQYMEENGIKRPTVFQAVWHYDDGDLVYFDGRGTITAFN